MARSINIVFGELKAHNRDFLDKEISNSTPFINTFYKVNKFLNWQKGINSAPLLRDKYLSLLYVKGTYKDYEDLLYRLETYDNSYIKLYVLFTPKEKFLNVIKTEKIEIIDLNKSHKEDFTRYVFATIPQMNDDIFRELKRYIGYSIEDFQLYEDEINSVENLKISSIRKIIPERKILPIEIILKGILLKSKKGIIREHFRLCNKYSERWVLEYYVQIIDNILNLKSKLLSGTLTFPDISRDDKIKSLLPLVRDVDTIALLEFKLLLNKYDKFGLELYLLNNRIQVMKFLEANVYKL